VVHLEERLGRLSPEALAGTLRGVEKESLRVMPDGRLATTPHPAALGAALTHPNITTDFSESQIELITGVHPDAAACVQELMEIHQFVYRALGDEMLWASSMPCRLPPDDRIPLGQYGRSNVGRLKTVYRMGLSHRYGRRMQTISGVHYNCSLSEPSMAAVQRALGDTREPAIFRTDAYFALIRNFRRHSWLPLYLFGASPATCRSFVDGRSHRLQDLSADTLYLPHATSLRMGPLGYQSDAQRRLAVSYNSLASYAGSLQHALTEPYPQYAEIGIRDDDGGYRQLATTLLQIENEFYGTIRPKRRINRGERPLHALIERGVEYVEVRSLDVDPFSPVGVTAATMRFFDVFLLHCLLADSPPDTPEEIATIAQNQYHVAERGREPGLALRREGVSVRLADWGRALVADCAPIAAALDRAHGGNAYRDTMSAARAAIDDPDRTPSARVLREMREHHHDSYVEFALARSLAHREQILAEPLAPEALRRLQHLADESIARQRAVEESDSVPFEEYRQRYLSRDLGSGLRLSS
jgi:glutamate--cysteine ligase